MTWHAAAGSNHAKPGTGYLAMQPCVEGDSHAQATPALHVCIDFKQRTGRLLPVSVVVIACLYTLCISLLLLRGMIERSKKAHNT